MRVIVKTENEEAVERVRKRDGDTSATETVNRLIREADVRVKWLPLVDARTQAEKDEEIAHVTRTARKMGADVRRAKRKGAKS